MKVLTELTSPDSTDSSSTDVSTKPLIFSPTAQPDAWSFKLILPGNPNMPTHSAPYTVQLSTVSITHPGPGFPTFLLESSYTLSDTLPRSLFIVLQQQLVKHSFVFGYKDPGDMEHFAFQEMVGLRRTMCFKVREEGSVEANWELHLKPTRERT
jgi:hypothetical protein